MLYPVFLKKPGLEFFERKEVDVEGMKEFALDKKARFLELELSSDRQEGDIAGTKMRKIFGFFVRELERKGQKVSEDGFRRIPTLKSPLAGPRLSSLVSSTFSG